MLTFNSNPNHTDLNPDPTNPSRTGWTNKQLDSLR